MHSVYGIDLGDETYLYRRSWRWLAVRIFGLLSIPPHPIYDPRGVVHWVPGSRLALALEPTALPSVRQENG